MSAYRGRRLKSLSGVFGEIRRSEKWGRKLSRHPVFRIWEDAVGEALARVARPVEVKGSVLWVEVSDPVWMQELDLMRDDILAKVNQRLESRGLEEIRCRAGSGEWEPGGVDRSGHTGYANPMLLPGASVSAADVAAVRKVLEEFGDSSFSGTVESLMKQVRARASRGEENPEGRECE